VKVKVDVFGKGEIFSKNMVKSVNLALEIIKTVHVIRLILLYNYLRRWAPADDQPLKTQGFIDIDNAWQSS